MVVVVACDDEVIPLQERIETVTDESDLEEVYNTERHLLYVACTRARNHLLLTTSHLNRSFCRTYAVRFRYWSTPFQSQPICPTHMRGILASNLRTKSYVQKGWARLFEAETSASSRI